MEPIFSPVADQSGDVPGRLLLHFCAFISRLVARAQLLTWAPKLRLYYAVSARRPPTSIARVAIICCSSVFFVSAGHSEPSTGRYNYEDYLLISACSFIILAISDIRTLHDLQDSTLDSYMLVVADPLVDE